MDCVFCKIVSGDIPSKKAYEDDEILAFYDINPQSPVHILVIPKQHIASAGEISPANSAIVAKIFERIAVLACESGLGNGFRIVTNCGSDGRQSVAHLHFHLLGGAQLSEHMA